MIKVTRINGGTFVINSDLIEFIEEKPETIICLTTGKKIMVKESVDEVIKSVKEFRGDSQVIRIKETSKKYNTETADLSELE
ncbi:MAG: flagellar protein FlbD [candidate division Zixibacteria bacterium]|nr:flagellar protein FlbD [candidate division Zixibacteria bacterium]